MRPLPTNEESVISDYISAWTELQFYGHQSQTSNGMNQIPVRTRERLLPKLRKLLGPMYQIKVILLNQTNLLKVKQHLLNQKRAAIPLP